MKSAAETTLASVHHQVKALADALGIVIGLVSRAGGVGEGLVRLDLEANQAGADPSAGVSQEPELASDWRASVARLRACLEGLAAFWDVNVEGIESSPRQLFAQVAAVEAAWGPLRSLSHHGLVIDGVRLLLDPGTYPSMGGDLDALLLRRRMVEHLVHMNVTPLYFHLDREASLCLGQASSPPDAQEYLRIDRENETATWRGTTHALSPSAMRILCRLRDADGGFVPAKWLKGSRGSDERPDRIIARMPEPIRALIESKPGSGTRLTVPTVE
jgi:hypothetical protein